MSKIADIIDARLSELGIKGSKMCDDLGVSRSTLTELRKGRATTLKADRAAAIAGYLGISMEELLGERQKETAPASLNKRDERDIEKRLAAALGDLEQASQADGLMFDGEPLDEETKELLAASLRSTLEMTKRLAKQKYTPKKYRKEGE